MTAFGRDGTEVEALLTDLYLERVLARNGTDLGPGSAELDPALRRASDRLRRDLTRVHPSFRFEERLAVRLAEAAAAARLPQAAGEGGAVVSLSVAAPGRRRQLRSTGRPTGRRRRPPRPAGAAYRRRRADLCGDLDRRCRRLRRVALVAPEPLGGRDGPSRPRRAERLA